MEHIVIKEVKLDSRQTTGKTKHYIGDVEMPIPYKLQIAQYEGDPGFYLFYLNNSGEIMTDTYHHSIDSAEDQAEWEFAISPGEWEK